MSSLVYRIHGTAPGEFEDSVVVCADSVEELRAKAKDEADKRGWVQCWSEAVEENSNG